MAKSKDLRDIAITHYKNGKKAPEIAVLLANKVYRATIHRWICQYDRTGSFRAGKPTGRKRNGRTKRLVNLEEGDRLFGHSNWCLQQDGASAHTSKESQDWCKRHLKYFIPEDRWPPNSPELNPLDYSIWDSMSKNNNYQNVQTKNDLEREIRRAWKKIDLNYVRQVIGAFLRRVSSVEKHNGKIIIDEHS
ncbi:unnamed protein product [Rotaria sp. Silwood1]|nr:unnamed protein product [Rotaria sp. Silwood1]